VAEQENFALCDDCGENEAVYTVSVMMGGEITQRRLCPDCMARMNMNLSAGNVKKMLSAILSALTGQEDSEAADQSAPEEEDATACERCGMTIGQFTKSGKLGCPMCYTAFREKLTPMLQQIHGRVQHAGRKPTQDEASQRRRTLAERLSRELEAAVVVEDYETAALIRDRIRGLNQESQEGSAG